MKLLLFVASILWLATVHAIACESRHLDGGVSIAVDNDGYSVVVEEDLPYDREIPALGLSVMLNSGGQSSEFDGGIFYLTAQNLKSARHRLPYLS